MRMRHKKWSNKFLEQNQEIHYQLENPYKEKDESVAEVIDKLLVKANQFKEIVLEIGTGKGGFCTQFAQKHSDKLFIGFEKNLAVASLCLKGIVENNLTNCFLFIGDFSWVAELLIKKNLKATNIFLNFSDPWPKSRYHKRRLVDQWYVDTYRNLLIENGKVNFKTDNVSLFAHGLETFNNNKWHFEKVTLDLENSAFAKENIITEYEAKFMEQNIKINLLVATT